MKIYHGFGDGSLRIKRRGVAIGVFDGVHRGHQRILRKVIRESARRGLTAMAVTFDPHPSRVLKGEKGPSILMSLPHRIRLFERMGFAETLIVRFNRKFSRVSRETFLKKLLIKRLGMKALVVGRDFCFGRRGLGNARFLKENARRLGYRLWVVPPLKEHGQVISSTRIRRLIEAGRLERASRMLGRPVSVHGTVVKGKGRGGALGFPTANVNPHHEVLPPEGVWAAWGRWSGKRFRGVLNIGPRPTFGEREKVLEVHFPDYRGNLYGRDIELTFVARLRGVRRFRSERELAAAIRADIRKARQVLSFTKEI